MPLVDKPLSELLCYSGINPRPADFDAYWDTALCELAAHDPQVELIRDETLPSRHAESYHLWFTGIGGARVYAKYQRPKQVERPVPAVLAFHGYSGASGEWVNRLAYVAEGFCVAALDCRGQGGRSGDVIETVGNTLRGHIIRGLEDADPRRLYYRQAFLDTALLARIVMGFAEVDADRVGAMGGSQGGGLTLACAALEPRIRRAAPVYPFLSDYQRVWEMDLCKGAYEELGHYFRQWDPLHQREEAIFTRLGYIDIQHLAPRIRAEVLMGVGLMDTICPPSTQFAAYNKIQSPKDVVIYPDYGHETLPGFADRTFAFLMGL